MPVQQFASFITSLNQFDFKQSQLNAITSNTEALADLQAQQFAQGKDKAGNEIRLNGNGYNPFYADKKRKYGIGLGAVTSRITLFYSGLLYKELFASVVSGKVTFESRVAYWFELLGRTGDITGVDADSAKEFANGVLLPAVNMDLKQKTGLSITSKTGIVL